MINSTTSFHSATSTLRTAAWMDSDSRVPMLPRSMIYAMTGKPEFKGVVKHFYSGEEFDRFLCPVVLLSAGRAERHAWADTTTGSIYWLDGRCASGPLNLLLAPVSTGRNVPSMTVRDREGKERLKRFLWGEDED